MLGPSWFSAMGFGCLIVLAFLVSGIAAFTKYLRS
jgi:hypothetical protein